MPFKTPLPPCPHQCMSREDIKTSISFGFILYYMKIMTTSLQDLV